MFKRAIIFSIIFGSAVFTSNQVQAYQLQSIFDCTKIAKNENRLACFDAASKALIDSGDYKVVVKEPVFTKEEKVANFGKAQLRSSPAKKIREKQKKEEKAQSAKELKEIKLAVVEVTYTTLNKFILFMENGQIWKQKSNGRIPLPKGKFEVVIKKAIFNGYNMIVPTKKSIIKVKRLR